MIQIRILQIIPDPNGYGSDTLRRTPIKLDKAAKKNYKIYWLKSQNFRIWFPNLQMVKKIRKCSFI